MVNIILNTNNIFAQRNNCSLKQIKLGKDVKQNIKNKNMIKKRIENILFFSFFLFFGVGKIF